MHGTLFISDLHLDASRPDVVAAFHTFIREEATEAAGLYILGDLFEAWIGDDDPSELAESVKQSLLALRHKGVPVWLMHGNRDFLIGKDFCNQAGCELLPDPTVISLYGQDTLLMHGDSLCTSDQEYMAFRTTMRQPETQQQLLAMPLEQRRQLASDLRSKSSEAMSNKAEDILDVTPEAVDSIMQQHKVNRLIHGHTHRPARHSLADSTLERIVLGDWDSQLWVLQASAESLQLHSQDLVGH